MNVYNVKHSVRLMFYNCHYPILATTPVPQYGQECAVGHLEICRTVLEIILLSSYYFIFLSLIQVVFVIFVFMVFLVLIVTEQLQLSIRASVCP